MTAPELPRPTPPYLADEAALEAFITAWRAGTLPKAAWTHAAHVAVCAYHGWADVPLEEVFSAMKAGIVAYNEAVGTANTPTSSYHETLTRFWAGTIVAHLAAARQPTRLEAVRAAIAAFGDARKLHAAHYSSDVVTNQDN